MLDNYKVIKLTDYCHIERAKKGKVYPKGSTCVQVSATKGQLIYNKEDTKVESKYAVIIPNDELDGQYLYYVMVQAMPYFLSKYQTDINIQPEVFSYMRIQVHTDVETQREIGQALGKVDEMLELEKQTLDRYKKAKKYYLDKMMI